MWDFIPFILSFAALAGWILSWKRSALCRGLALAGLLASTLLVRWLLREGSVSLQHCLTGLFALALAAACWADRKKGRGGAGLLAVLTFLFGILPLMAALRLLALEPDQLPDLQHDFITALLCLPAGLSAGACLPAALRRRQRETER